MLNIVNLTDAKITTYGAGFDVCTLLLVVIILFF